MITELTMIHRFGVTMARAQVCEAIHASQPAPDQAWRLCVAPMMDRITSKA